MSLAHGKRSACVEATVHVESTWTELRTGIVAADIFAAAHVRTESFAIIASLRNKNVNGTVTKTAVDVNLIFKIIPIAWLLLLPF